MTDANNFQLDRLYFGILAEHGAKISNTPGVIARTPDVTSTHITECLRLAQLAPPPPDQCSDQMPGALGLFRGETTDFILAKAQYNDAGLPQLLYILMPATPLRRLGGNVLAFRSLGMMEMPSFASIRQNLVPFELRDPAPMSATEQSDTLLDLLQYSQDSFKNVEGILAGLVQGLPLAIVNSPSSLDQRLRFIEGLLSLLPVPARIGITFATHVQDPALSQAQIKFASHPSNPPGHLVYDWAAGKLLVTPPDDSYSHYMVAQLRLDPSLVVEQTGNLSRTAVWRAMHKENLGIALAWVSRRAAIDQSVRDGQPVDREIVSAILREDPTLSDELRQSYIRHLLAFALALDDPSSTAIIPSLAAASPEIATLISEQLNTAIESGQSWIVYSLLEGWLLRVSDVSAEQWVPILQTAARKHLSELLAKEDIQQAVDFLDYIKNAHPSLQLASTMPSLIATAQNAARTHPQLAQALFLLAVESLASGDLVRLLSDTDFVTQLPRPLQMALAFLQPEPRHPAPPHVLDHATQAFEEKHRMLILVRLVEWAMYLQRPELVDTAALQALLVMAQSPQAERYQELIQQVVDEFSQVSIIQVLDPPGARVLVQLLLQTGQFENAIRLLEFYQNTVIRPDRLEDFTRLAGEVFALTPLPGDQITKALNDLEGSQIRSEPRAMIFCSALVNRQWADDQEYAARRLTSMIFNDNSLIRIVGRENTLKLLEFYARRRNALDTLRVGAALVDHTLGLGNEGAVLITQMWPKITWDAEVSEAALELLRRYVRGVPLTQVPAVIAYFRGKLGAEVVESLQATHLMRLVLGDSGLMRFTDDIHTTATLFVDIATTYHTNKEPPPNHRLRRDLDQMSGGLNETERAQVATNMLNISRLAYELGRNRSQKHSKQSTSEMMLIQGKMVPENGVDLLRFIGGHFSRQEALDINLEREAMAHILGTRSAAMLLRETDAIHRLLSGLQAAFREKVPPIQPTTLTVELDSLWGTLSLYNQRRIQDEFAQDCQQLAEVLCVMADQANERVLSDTSVGRQLETGQRQPGAALEALRWINGYFARKHTR